MADNKIKKSFFELMAEKNIDETKEIIVSNRYKEIPFKIRAMKNDEYFTGKTRFTKGGEFDAKGFMYAIIKQCTVEPNFKDAQAIAEAKVVTPEQLIDVYLNAGEIDRLSTKIVEFSGFGKLDEVETEIENF